MTTITIRTEGTMITGFTVDGHSGYAPEGQDIVCAGLSALAVTAANALREVADVVCATEMRDGYLSVTLPRQLPDECCEKAEVIMKTAVIGFKSIAAEYSEFVTMNGGADQ